MITARHDVREAGHPQIDLDRQRLPQTIARHSRMHRLLGFRRWALHARCATKMFIPPCPGITRFFTAWSAGQPHRYLPRGLFKLSHGLHVSWTKPPLASAVLHMPNRETRRRIAGSRIRLACWADAASWPELRLLTTI
jgi:hypothetical protein